MDHMTQNDDLLSLRLERLTLNEGEIKQYFDNIPAKKVKKLSTIGLSKDQKKWRVHLGY